jgi:hypothetical protein
MGISNGGSVLPRCVLNGQQQIITTSHIQARWIIRRHVCSGSVREITDHRHRRLLRARRERQSGSRTAEQRDARRLTQHSQIHSTPGRIPANWNGACSSEKALRYPITGIGRICDFRHERPYGRGTANKSNEIPPPH